MSQRIQQIDVHLADADMKRSQGEYAQAKQDWLKVLDFAAEIHDDSITAHVLQQLACCALRMQDFPGAIHVRPASVPPREFPKGSADIVCSVLRGLQRAEELVSLTLRCEGMNDSDRAAAFSVAAACHDFVGNRERAVDCQLKRVQYIEGTGNDSALSMALLDCAKACLVRVLTRLVPCVCVCVCVRAWFHGFERRAHRWHVQDSCRWTSAAECLQRAQTMLKKDGVDMGALEVLPLTTGV